MNTGKKELSDPSKEQGQQRVSSFDKVKQMLPVRSKDNFMLLVLLVLGLSGFAYIMSVPVGSKANKGSFFDKIFKPKKGQAITSNFIKSNLVTIGGEMKANSPITFSFNGLCEENEYELNFGDESIKTVSDESMSHIFEKAGTYKLEMKKISRGHIYVVHCEYLNIQ